MKVTRKDVIKYIEDFLSGTDKPLRLGLLFISVRDQENDQVLEAVRLKVGSLPDQYPPDRKLGGYCNEKGT